MSPAPVPAVGRRALRKVAWRLIPFMGLMYFVAFLDRVNIGFAALTMNEALGLTASMFGFASGIFFLGYVLFEIPSNLVLERVGARLWIARIMITWGLLSAGTAFVGTPTSLYVLRFLLGVAEAGFFPGMILYLTYWFPAAHRARILGAFMIALPISSVIGGPISTAMLSLDALGLSGWQWMFLLEGIPAVVLGVVVLVVLRDRPSKAAWLDEDERQWLESELARERAQIGGSHRAHLMYAFKEPRVWFLGLIYFGLCVGLYGLGMWLPQIVRGLGELSNVQIGFLVAIPYSIAAVAMFLWGRHSDKTGERIRHVAAPALIGGIALAASAHLTASPVLSLVALSLSAVGVYASLPVFWTLPTAMLSGTAAAAGIALVNSIGNIGGFMGPYLVGYVKGATGSYAASLWSLAGLVAFAGIAVLAFAPHKSAGTLQSASVVSGEQR